MTGNTIATVGNIHYLWGIFLLICSLRKNGMNEPVVVGTRGFTPDAEEVLTQLGGVTIVPLHNIQRSLTCCKPQVMLQAQTDYITWVDSDGYFTGNCSEQLIPLREDEIHIRMRSAAENRRVFRGHSGNGDAIPREILEVWRRDVGSTDPPRLPRACSACCFSVHRTARPFLQKWHEQMEKVLPNADAGVVDRSLKYYHQLDESVLNSLLAFSPLAPRVAREYRLDKNPEAMFIHLVGIPKPWECWTGRHIRRFDDYCALADYAVRQGYRLPGGGPLPFSLNKANRFRCFLLCGPAGLAYKVCRRVKRIFQ